jgi:hypothetical protein
MTSTIATLGGRLTALLIKDFASVLLPGLVVIGEGWVIADYPSLPHEVPNDVIVLFPFLLLFAYVVGFTERQISFFAIERNLWRFFAGGEVDRSAPYGEHRWGLKYYNRAAFQRNYEVLAATFGADTVRRTLATHPIGSLFTLPDDGSASRPTADYHEVFHYCKNWLTQNAPRHLRTEDLEVQFNTQFAAIIPTLLAPAAILRLSGSLGIFGVSLTAACIIAWTLYRRGEHLRHREVFDSLQNLLLTEWFSAQGKTRYWLRGSRERS